MRLSYHSLHQRRLNKLVQFVYFCRKVFSVLDNLAASVGKQRFTMAVPDGAWFAQFNYFNVESISLLIVRPGIEHIANCKDCAEEQVQAFVVPNLIIKFERNLDHVFVNCRLFLPIRFEIQHLNTTIKGLWHSQWLEEGLRYR